jgi:hypothetical protein
MTIKVPSNEFRIRIPYFHISVHIINLALNDMKFPPIVFKQLKVPYKESRTCANKYLVKGVKPIIHQSELRAYTKVVPFKENSSFRFVVL